jgi:Ca2+-binding RTX toxin-like protein
VCPAVSGQPSPNKKKGVTFKGGVMTKIAKIMCLMAILLFAASSTAWAIKYCKGSETCYGSDKPQTIWGSSGSDVIYARGGADDVTGEYGNDKIYGQDGHDEFLDGGGGDDLVKGGDGNDWLVGDRGNDSIYGGPGFDTCDASKKKDKIIRSCEFTY